jgi:hypothetical protein
MGIEEVDLDIAIEIALAATGALADTFPLILEQDSEVISVDITIIIQSPQCAKNITCCPRSLKCFQQT